MAGTGIFEGSGPVDRRAETVPDLTPLAPADLAPRRPGPGRRLLGVAIDVAAAGTLASLVLGRLWCWYGFPWHQWPGAVLPGLAALLILVRHVGAPLHVARGGAWILAALGASDTVHWYLAWAAQAFTASFPLPLSLLIALVPGLWALAPAAGPSWLRPRAWAAALVLILVTVFLHIELTAIIDHRRPADAIVVPGAKVNDDGEASPALADRVRTGCTLYHDGYATTLVLSGGHAPGLPVSEPQAMRRLALDLGVPDAAIICDEQGWTTAGTVRQAAKLAQARGWTSVLVVSHGYHLARIQVLAADQDLCVVTVPAKQLQSHWHVRTVLREVVAWIAAWAGLDDLRHRQTGDD